MDIISYIKKMNTIFFRSGGLITTSTAFIAASLGKKSAIHERITGCVRLLEFFSGKWEKFPPYEVIM